MNEKAQALAEYIKALPDFTVYSEVEGNYQNMGALIIDAILQSGINYNSVVRPRVQKFLSEYPDVVTIDDFKRLIEEKTVSKIINWKESAKTERIYELTHFLSKKGVNTGAEFKDWLRDDANIRELKKLSGIKNKTADYLKILSGHNTNAIDRHVMRLFKEANIIVSRYNEAKLIISETATLLDMDESILDYSIWRYMSEMAAKR